MNDPNKEKCHVCYGGGEMPKYHICHMCKGNGWVWREPTVKEMIRALFAFLIAVTILLLTMAGCYVLLWEVFPV